MWGYMNRYVGALCFWVDCKEGPLNERLDRRVLQMMDVRIRERNI